MQNNQEEQSVRVRRLKVTCINSKYAQYIQKLYPELIVVPFGTALKYKKDIDAFITVKGRWAFLARFLKMPVWNIRDGVYKLPGVLPASFILEKKGSFLDARTESDWEDCVRAAPSLLNIFKKFSINEEEDIAKYSSMTGEDTQLTAYAKRFLSLLPISFPALSPYGMDDVKEILGEVINQKIGIERYVLDASPYKLFTPGGRKRVVIIEQARKTKQELKKVFATEQSFIQMVLDAKEQHPGAAFFLLQPPSVLQGKKKGYLKKFALENGIQIISEQVMKYIP